MVNPFLLKTKDGPILRLCVQKRGEGPGHQILIDIIPTVEDLELQIKILEKAKADWLELNKLKK